MTTTQRVQADCQDCGAARNHEVIHEVKRNYSEDEEYAEFHQIIECSGCGKRGFRSIVEEYYAGWRTEEGEFDYPVHVKIYPEVYNEVKIISHRWHLPKSIREIYEQTMSSAAAKSFIMVGFGLRAIIEGICLEQSIAGKNLHFRIQNLAKAGLITKADEKFLHGIRFAGNDAAHELRPLTDRQAEIGLRIVNNLLYSLYTREVDNSGALETPIETLDELLTLIRLTIKTMAVGEEKSLDALLGPQRRRLPEDPRAIFDEFEKAVIAGQLPMLSLGAKPLPPGAKNPVQLFLRS